MKKIKLLSLISLLSVSLLYGQQNNKTEEKAISTPSNFENVKITGSIKTLKIKEGKVKENKDKTEYIKSPAYAVMKYDKSGNITEEQQYKNQDTLIKTVKYFYNDKNNKTADSAYDAKKKLVEYTEYKYDALGNLESEMKYNSNKQMFLKKKYIINVRNKVSELKFYDGEGKPTEKYSYFYNKNGGIVEKSHFVSNGLDYKLVIEYNDKGIKEIENYFNSNGEISKKIEFYSMEKANESISCFYGKKEMIDRVCYHKYTYDKKGNPIKNIILASDSFGKKPVVDKMQEIEIEYY